ncbi:MAG: heme exporter protein CcmD [Rhodospirillaceae bacterium]|jgi:heme exporter protein D|nr:heme exporter protein CcmD [Rhodospirillaceae bacterium]
MPESFTEFLSMGGYGSFIWAAFGLSAVVLIGILIQSQRFLKASDAELNALQSVEASNGDEA